MLFLLKRIGASGYDEYTEKLIRSSTPESARKLANKHCGDEGGIWTDPTRVSCRVIKESGRSGEIIANYNAG